MSNLIDTQRRILKYSYHMFPIKVWNMNRVVFSNTFIAQFSNPKSFYLLNPIIANICFFRHEQIYLSEKISDIIECRQWVVLFLG